MKKSFFKRAVATVAAVPLALTQCLTSSFAETTVDKASQADAAVAAAGEKTYTLDTLLRIEPEKKYSEWNLNADTALLGLSAMGKASGTINIDKFAALTSKAGKFSALAENVLGQVKNAQYRITNTNDIIITADIENISEALNKDFSLSFGSAVRMLVEGSGVEELYEIDYTTVDASGKIEIVIGGSELINGTMVPATFKFTPNGGKTLDLMGSVAYANQTIEEYRAIAYAKIDELADKLDTVAAKEEIDKSFDLYLGRIQAAVDNYMKLVDMNKSKKYDSISGVLAAINYRLEIAGVQRKLPTTGAGLASNAIVSTTYDIVKDMINNSAAGAVNFDIELSEVGAFLDELRNIEASAQGGVYTLKAEFDDAEAAEVAEYYNNTDTEGQYVNSYKIITGKGAIGGDNYVDVQIERVVITTDKTTTTTTTTTDTTSTSTETTTTSSTDTTTSTSTETTTTSSTDTTTSTSTETTTTSSTDTTTSTSTETTTTSSTDTTTSTSTETTTTSSTDTTTSSSETTTTSSTDTTTSSSETTTTSSSTTSTSSTSSTTSTTTNVTKVLVTSYAEVDSDYAFYYSYEEKFNNAQLGFAVLYNVYDLIAIDENGEYVLDENGEKIVVNNEVEIEDISGLVDFGDATPANTFNVENTTFRYDVPLSYFGDALLDEDGNAITAEAYIGKRGDVTLDNIITVSDATYMLTAYTKINAVTGAVDANTVLFTRDVLTKDPASVLDQFAAFLGDVDCNITDNFQATKDQRAIIATDATYILSASVKLNSNYTGTEKALWEEILGKTL